MVAEVIEHNNYLHSLLVKTAIYGYDTFVINLLLRFTNLSIILYILFLYRQTPDHPKLYLWSEQGSNKTEEPPQNKLEECKITYHYFYLLTFKIYL